MEGKKWIAPDSEGYTLFSLQHFLEDQKQLGYRSVSLWGGSPHIFVDCYGYESPAEINTLMQGYGIEPVCYRPQAYGYTPCAPKGSLLRVASLDYYRFSVELASRLRAPLMVMEIGGMIRDREEGRQKEEAIEGVRFVAQECRSQGIRLAIIAGMVETGALINSLKDMVQFLKGVGDCDVKAAFDADAARQEGETLADWFRVLGADLCHVRTRKKEVDFIPEFKGTGYTGYYECLSSPAAAAEEAAKGTGNI